LIRVAGQGQPAGRHGFDINSWGLERYVLQRIGSFLLSLFVICDAFE